LKKHVKYPFKNRNFTNVGIVNLPGKAPLSTAVDNHKKVKIAGNLFYPFLERDREFFIRESKEVD